MKAPRLAARLLAGRRGAAGHGDTSPAGPAVALSQRYSYRLQNSRFASPPEPGRTISTLLHLEAEPIWVRLIFVNDGPDPWTIDAASIAPTAAVGNGYAPIDAGGAVDPSAWRRVTFEAGGGDSQPALAPSGDARTTLAVPGFPGDGRPVRHVFSDWVPITALPRRDGGFGWLLQVRTYSRGSMRFAASAGGPDAAIGRFHRGFSAPGNQAGGEEGGPPDPADRMFACHGVQYLSPTPGLSVIGIGDSIIQSSCSTGEISSFGIRACVALSNPARPVSYVNEGFPGRNSLNFCANGLWGIEALRPQVAIIAPWSQNEPWTIEMADIAFGRAVAVMDAARRHGCVPILTTTAPVFVRHPEADAIRRRTNDRVRAVGRGGIAVLDVDAIWGTGSCPNAYRPEYDADDQTHPNDRACAAAAKVLAPMLTRIIDRG